ncbi:hypothetical protein G5V59_27375 [Nocardioides sp. W3-2-3]|uniref:hypothetical protein n=1 Tax=Nocardioides convexus TaxID=2712224 RepID=UPI00241884F9|nr:hypothetical protein [Nocardioides convexus]NHA02104.1 hypothetical protein [Nocardioides convexus]
MTAAADAAGHALVLAGEQWAGLAVRLAARGRMRVSRNGRDYALRGERFVTVESPNQPAAVMVYDRDGCAPVLFLDLDSHDLGAGAVDRDHATITTLLRRTGAAWFSDRSPNGGRHIYIPLETPLPYPDARAVMARFRALAPTLDPQPMLGLTAGCIRPPGARHRTGGHQAARGRRPRPARRRCRPTRRRRRGTRRAHHVDGVAAPGRRAPGRRPLRGRHSPSQPRRRPPGPPGPRRGVPGAPGPLHGPRRALPAHRADR